MERQKKKHKGLKVLLCVIIVLAVFIAAINIIPGKKAAANPFLSL